LPRAPGTSILRTVSEEPAIYREEVVGTMFTIADIAANVQAIARLLEGDDGGEEETPEDPS
jgi:hypothetical protein